MTEPKEMAEMPAKKKQETEQPAGAVVKSTNGGNDLEFSIFKKDAAELSTLLKGNLGGRTLTAADLVRAPIPAGGGTTWEIESIDGIEKCDEIEGVIIHQQQMRAFWPDAEINGEPPICRSDDAMTGIGAIQADQPAESRDCITCPMAQWGSDPKGGKGQACTLKRALFILRADSILPMVVMIPPSSLKNIDRYLLALLNASAPYWGAITGLSLEKAKGDSGSYSRVKARRVAPLSPEQTDRMKMYQDDIAPSLSRGATAAPTPADTD